MKIGVLGCGSFATRRLLPLFQPFGIQNRTLEKAESIAREFNISFFTSRERELVFHPEIEAVIITSPNHLHRTHLALCAERNLPVLCEKPLGISYQECLEVVESFPNRLLVGQSYRFKDSLRVAKRLIAGRTLQQLEIKMHIPVPKENWRHRKECGGGVLLDIGIHAIDTVHFLTGSHIITSKAISTRSLEVETTVLVSGELESGARISLSLSFDLPYETGFSATFSDGALYGTYTFRQADDKKETLSLNGHPIDFERNNIYLDQIRDFVSGSQSLDAREMLHNYRVLDSIADNFDS